MAAATTTRPTTTPKADAPKVWNDQTPERLAQDKAMDRLNNSHDEFGFQQHA